MAKAKFYIYRNLHKDAWSIRYKGRIIAHAYANLKVYDPEFKVNEAGRLKVIAEKRKNVHAFVVGTNFAALTGLELTPHGEATRGDWEHKMRAYVAAWAHRHEGEITYNPYKGGNFYYKKDGNLPRGTRAPDIVLMTADKKLHGYNDPINH